MQTVRTAQLQTVIDAATLAADPDERRAPRAPFVSRAWGDFSPCYPLELTEHCLAQLLTFAHQLKLSRGGRFDLWRHVLVVFCFGGVQAGILNPSPCLSTAQHMRAFLAAMATMARQ